MTRCVDKPSPLRVLYVEDNDVNVELVRAMATHLGGIDLDVAGTGAEAVQRFDGLHPDLLLVDMHLGDMTGIDVLDRLRAESKALPMCVALTADAMSSTETAASAAGFSLYLTKPVRMAELASAFGAARERRAQAGR